MLLRTGVVAVASQTLKALDHMYGDDAEYRLRPDA